MIQPSSSDEHARRAPPIRTCKTGRLACVLTYLVYTLALCALVILVVELYHSRMSTTTAILLALLFFGGIPAAFSTVVWILARDRQTTDDEAGSRDEIDEV